MPVTYLWATTLIGCQNNLPMLKVIPTGRFGLLTLYNQFHSPMVHSISLKKNLHKVDTFEAKCFSDNPI